MKNILTGFIISTALAIGISQAARAEDSPDAILKLLADAQAQSSQLSLQWKAYAKQPAISWASDTAEVTRMKDDLNALGRTITALKAARTDALFAQLAAIDRIVPVVQEIAESTTKAIGFLAKNQTRLTDKQYKDYIEQNSDTANRLSTLVSQLVEYEGRKARFDLAKRNLQLAVK